MKFKHYLVLFLLMICVVYDRNCIKLDRYDIYKTVPIGSPLTKEVFLKSEQIIQNESDLILLFNNSKDEEYYDPHLLFFNSKRTLYAACYFPSEKIESVKNNVIGGFLNNSRDKRKSWYRNDLPQKYHLDMQDIDSVQSSSGRSCNKVIERILIDSLDLNITFFIRKAKNDGAGITWEDQMNTDLSFFNDFTDFDTLKFPVAELHFNKTKRIISTRNSNLLNPLIWDEMIVFDKSILDRFYDQLFEIMRKAKIADDN